MAVKLKTSKAGKSWVVSLIVLLFFGAACRANLAAPDLGINVPEDYLVELYADGLEGPTQIIEGPDGRIYLAQLNGPEGEGAGQVLALDLEQPSQREVLLEGIFKPTGLAITDHAIWLASGRNLLRAELDANGMPSPPETILENLPFNGRSNGTLTITPQGDLLYETSGRRSGNEAADRSGSLWLIDPTNPSVSIQIATGLKNAYAHTFDESGQLWATEVGDDPVNGGPPPDELNLITRGTDYGWPACFGKQQAARNYGGTEVSCLETEPAVAVFPPRSTPTSVVASPWESGVFLVALWGPTDPSVVRVQITEQADSTLAAKVTPFLTGLAHPQSLLVLPNGSLLVSDFESGNIYRVNQLRK